MDFGGEGGRVDAHDDDAGLAVRQPVHRVQPQVARREAGPEDERVRRVVLGRKPLLPVLRGGNPIDSKKLLRDGNMTNLDMNGNKR